MAILPTDRITRKNPVDSAPTEQDSIKDAPVKKEVKLKGGDVLVNEPQIAPDNMREEKTRAVAMLFGRMNPPTKGHEENIEGLKKLAKQHSADHVVIASHSHDKEKNPLSAEQKMRHMKRAFPGTNMKVSTKEQPTILHHAAELHKQGYRHLIVAGGGDRAEEYHKLLNKYNNVPGRHGHYNFDKIEVKSTGERKEGVSGSDMRKHVKSGNFNSFRAGLPSRLQKNEKHAKELFHDVHKGLQEAIEYKQAIVEKVQTFMERKQFNELAEELGRIYDDIIESKQNEQLEESFDTPYFNQHIAAHKGKNYGEIAKHYGAEKTKEHITNLTKERDALMAKHRTIKAGMFHDQAIRGLKAGLKHINESADPSTYLQMAAKARTRGELQKAGVYTRMAAAARRGDEASLRTLHANLSSIHECDMNVRLKAKAFVKKKAESK